MLLAKQMLGKCSQGILHEGKERYVCLGTMTFTNPTVYCPHILLERSAVLGGLNCNSELPLVLEDNISSLILFFYTDCNCRVLHAGQNENRTAKGPISVIFASPSIWELRIVLRLRGKGSLSYQEWEQEHTSTKGHNWLFKKEWGIHVLKMDWVCQGME
jgi:hypothetical protein